MSNAATPSKQSGFTLLEILVVLAILGLVLAVSAPPLARTLESVSFKTKADDIQNQINDMRIAALLTRSNIILTAENDDLDWDSDFENQDNNTDDRDQFRNVGFDASQRTYQYAPVAPEQRSLTMPEGWSLRGENIIFLNTGVCLGGTLEVRAPSGQKRSFNFKAPDCSLLLP